MAKNYLNVGCGNKFHKDWTNIDMASNSPHVQAVNLLKGIPFDDEQFDVVYHSQVLEHIPKNEADFFIKECFRVLKPGGILRVVVPDLENICREYLTLLDNNWNEGDEIADANYEWIKLELYDQTVRNKKGGMMAEYLRQEKLINEAYVIDRIGHVGTSIRGNQNMNALDKVRWLLSKSSAKVRSSSFMKNTINKVKLSFKKYSLSNEEKEYIEIGKFRMGGEIHYWMYDKYSLKKLLTKCGFGNISVLNHSSSEIPDWNNFELDVRNGIPFDPISLFMEAKKPSKSL